jgi:hypothetical protein
MFSNISFYSEELLALISNPKLEDELLSAVHGCLFIMFTATYHIWRLFLHLQPEDLPCYGERDPCIMADCDKATVSHEIAKWVWRLNGIEN